jgi:hypothetical protein
MAAYVVEQRIGTKLFQSLLPQNPSNDVLAVSCPNNRWRPVGSFLARIHIHRVGNDSKFMTSFADSVGRFIKVVVDAIFWFPMMADRWRQYY